MPSGIRGKPPPQPTPVVQKPDVAMPKSRRLVYLLLSFSAIGIVIAAVSLRRSSADVARPHLNRADQECVRVIDEHLKVLDSFFADAKTNTPRFADDVLGWSSKWRFAVDRVPFTTGDRHQTYLRGRFEERVFQQSALEAAVRQVVAGYLADIRSIEGRMLVDLRADVADLPTTSCLATLDPDTLKTAYDEAVALAIGATGSSLRADVAAELLTLITTEVLMQVAARMGVTGAIVGTGAAASWATLGISVIVALIVDQIVTWVWDRLADPRGTLAADLNAKLVEIHRLIVYGTDPGSGLRARLQQFSRERADVRRKVVLSLVRPDGAGVKP